MAHHRAGRLPLAPQPAYWRSAMMGLVVMNYLVGLALILFLGGLYEVITGRTGSAHNATVEIPYAQERDMAAVERSILSILETTPGVLSVRPINRRGVIDLIQPWLNDAPVPENLPLPYLIELTLEPDKAPTRSTLVAQLNSQIQGVSIEYHTETSAKSVPMETTLSLILGLLALLLFVAVLAVTAFVVRVALYSQQDVIDTLHFMGAGLWFIMRRLLRRFTLPVLLAALLGVALALLTYLPWVTGISTPWSLLAFPFVREGPLVWLTPLMIVPVAEMGFVTVVARRLIRKHLNRYI
ncbi:MAG: hypothetical protein V6Z81_03955 [Parvularculales bacterium]